MVQKQKAEIWKWAREARLPQYSRSAGSNLIDDGSGILPLLLVSISAQTVQVVRHSVYEILLFASFWYACAALVVQTGDDSLELVHSDTTAQ